MVMNPGNIGYFSAKGSVIVLLLTSTVHNHYGKFSEKAPVQKGMKCT